MLKKQSAEIVPTNTGSKQAQVQTQMQAQPREIEQTPRGMDTASAASGGMDTASTAPNAAPRQMDKATTANV